MNPYRSFKAPLIKNPTSRFPTRHHPQNLMKTSLLATLTLMIPPAMFGASYSWNSATSGNWDTSTANWISASGTTWSNSSGNDAYFNLTNTATTITATESITAGAINVGVTGSNCANYTFTTTGTNKISATSFTVNGSSANNNNSPGFPSTVLNNANVGITNTITISRANLTISGTSAVTATQVTGGVWASLTLSDSATLTLSSNISGGTAWGMNLNGGTLTTTRVQTATNNSGYPSNGTAAMYFNGGTLRAAGSSTSFVTDAAGNNLAYIGNGGAIVDSNGYNITIVPNLRNGVQAGASSTGNNQGGTIIALFQRLSVEVEPESVNEEMSSTL